MSSKQQIYIIDVGPEGGARGGTIVACGTPEEIAENPNSYTGIYIRKFLERDSKNLRFSRSSRVVLGISINLTKVSKNSPFSTGGR